MKTTLKRKFLLLSLLLTVSLGSCDFDVLKKSNENDVPMEVDSKVDSKIKEANTVLSQMEANDKPKTMKQADGYLRCFKYRFDELLKSRDGIEYFYYLKENQILAYENGSLIYPTTFNNVAKVDLWKLATSKDNLKDGYSHYLTYMHDPETFEEIEFSGGLDAGYSYSDYTKLIAYKNFTYVPSETESIVTNSTDKIIFTYCGNDSSINHYGSAMQVEVCSGTYIEHGVSIELYVESGNIVVTKEAKIFYMDISSSDSVKVIVHKQAEIPPMGYAETVILERYDNDYTNPISSESYQIEEANLDEIRAEFEDCFPPETAILSGLYLYYLAAKTSSKKSFDELITDYLNLTIIANLILVNINSYDQLIEICEEEGFNPEKIRIERKDYKLAFLLSESRFVLVYLDEITYPSQYAGPIEGLELWYFN